MDLTYVVLIGLGIGVVTRVLRPGRMHMSLLMAVFLGVTGAVLATLGGHELGLYQMGHQASLIGAAAGALLLLIMFNLVKSH